MADPLSIAASALAVAGAGGKLAQTLYIFIESVRKSEKQLRPVADHVKLTSVVLDNVGTLLGDRNVRSLCKDSLLGTTNEALEGCRKAFDELRRYVEDLLKQDGNGKTKLSAFDKLTFLPFRQRELNELQANLERFKGALDLVLGVLNLSVSIKNNKDASEIQQLKTQVEHLIQAKKDAEQALQAPSNLSSSHVGVETSVPKTDHHALHSSADASLANPQGPATNARSMIGTNSTKSSSINASVPPAASSFMVMTAKGIPEPPKRSAVNAQQPVARALPSERSKALERGKALEQTVEASDGQQIMPSRQDGPYDSDSGRDSDNGDKLLQHLAKCAEAVAELSGMIEQATEQWQSRRRYRRHGLTPAFQATHKAMKKLWAYEIDLDLSDGDESAASGKSRTKELAGIKKTSGVLKSAKASRSAPIDNSPNASGRNQKEYALTRRHSRSRSRDPATTAEAVSGSMASEMQIPLRREYDLPPSKTAVAARDKDTKLFLSMGKTRSDSHDRNDPYSRRSTPARPEANITAIGPEYIDDEIRCICDFRDDDGWTIACDSCYTWQHQECYYPQFQNQSLPETLEHFCVECKPRPLDAAAANARRLARKEEEAKNTKLRSRRVRRKGKTTSKSPNFVNRWALDALSEVQDSSAQAERMLNLPNHQIDPQSSRQQEPQLTLATPLGVADSPPERRPPALSLGSTIAENSVFDEHLPAGLTDSMGNFVSVPNEDPLRSDRDFLPLLGRVDYAAEPEQANSKLPLPSSNVTDAQTRAEKRRRPIPEREVAETPRYLRRSSANPQVEVRVGAETSSERLSESTKSTSGQDAKAPDFASGYRESTSSPKAVLPPVIDRERMSVDEQIALLRESSEFDKKMPADDGITDECKDGAEETFAKPVEPHLIPWSSPPAGEPQTEESNRRASSRPWPAQPPIRKPSRARRRPTRAKYRIVPDQPDLDLSDDDSLDEKVGDSCHDGPLQGSEAQNIGAPRSSEAYPRPSLNDPSTKPGLDAPEKFSAVDDLLREWTLLDV